MWKAYIMQIVHKETELQKYEIKLNVVFFYYSLEMSLYTENKRCNQAMYTFHSYIFMNLTKFITVND